MPDDRQPARETDRLLDRVLSDYAGEPLTGFENRVARGVREKRSVAARTWPRLWWPAAVAATIVAVISFAFGVRTGEQRENARWQSVAVARSTVPAAVAPAPQPVITPAVEKCDTSPVSSRPSRTRVMAHRNSRVFPTPAPLSAEERALANFAARSDPETVSSLLRPATTALTRTQTGPLQDQQ